MKKRHMNFCKDCGRTFEITKNIDYCEKCRIINNIRCGDFSDIPTEYDNQPEIISAIMRRYMEYGYE